MKILVLHIVPIKEVRANLIQTLNMAKSFNKSGAQVELSVISDEPKELVIAKLESIAEGIGESVSLRIFPSKLEWLKPSELARLISVYPAIRNTDAIIFTRSAFAVFIAFMMRKSVIYESHNAYFTSTAFLNWILIRFFRKKSFHERLRLFISISENLSNYWLNAGLSPGKLITLHDGVELKPLQNNTIPEDDEFLNSRLRFCYAGSLYADRRPDRFILLGKKFPQSDFVIVGGPEEAARELSDICSKEGIENVQFLGPIDHKNVREELLKADVLLALWSKEVRTIEFCSPLKLFEYMEVEKLIIADGYTPVKEVLTHEVNSLLVNPDDMDSLCNAIQKVHNDPKRLLNLGAGNRHLISSKYSWDKRASEILNKL